jgi:cell division protein FtsW
MGVLKMRFLPRIWSNHTEAIFYIVLILFLIGAVNVFSASFVLAGQLLNDSYFFIKRQLGAFAVGLVLMIMASRIDYHQLNRLLLAISLGTVGLLVAVHFNGVDTNGARRWLNMGFQFQPSEIAKLTVIILAASYLGPLIDRGRTATLFSWPVYISVVVGAMVLKQPDMGTALIIVGLCIVMYVIAGLPRRQKYLLYGGCVGLVLHFTFAAAYRADRIAAWLNPWDYQQTIGYQTVQSLMAIGSGGFFGAGLGMGASKFYYLPEAHTDFAFAVLCQEMGFLGALIVLVLLALLGCCGGQITRQAPDGFGKMLALGATTLVVGQAVVNIAMVSGLFPVVGVPLPFISFGGTSLIVNMLAIGLLMSVGRRSVAGNKPKQAAPVGYERYKRQQRLKLVRKNT